MKLSIIYYPKMERAWLLKRENGTHEQHAHFYDKKDAVQCRNLIDRNKYPYNPKFKYAMQRILTEEEFKKLDKKQRYYNSNKGVRRKKR